MIGKLLFRGMIAGIVAGAITFVFAHHFAEPQVERAIAFEEHGGGHAHGGDAHAHAHSHSHGDDSEGDGEAFSRQTQSGVGLLAGMMLMGAALGGGLALVWAFSYQRVAPFGPRTLALLLALGGFLALSVMPGIKYPPNPPAVGNPDTIGYRTALYFMMLLVSVGIIAVSAWCARRLVPRLGGWNAALLACLLGVTLLLAACALLPAINDVPETFSADLLWRFRLSSIGINFVLWAGIGVMFGALAENMLPARRQHMSFGHG
ncbi:MAG: CbtA family protein [Gibbsiella quercinecans]|uniref:CbtA family protein n=1 Tax=Gibbsiella quercinecans TaxID=929813 RepID=UPI003F3216AB